MNQNHAILGGANCFMVSPSDLGTALSALDARVEIAAPREQVGADRKLL